MEAGGLNVGHIFADLDARLDDKNFKRFDQAVDRSKTKAKQMAGEQDRLKRSTQSLSREQQKQAKFLRSQGMGWAAVAKEVGATEDQLRSYNTTVKTTVREQERTRKGTRDTAREFMGMDGSVSRVNRAMTFFRSTLRLLKWPALIAAVGGAAQGISVLTAGVTALTSALSPLSGLLVVLPSALGSFLQGLGTVALGVMGVTDAVKALSDQQVKAGGTAEDSAKKQRSAAGQIRSAEEQLSSAQRGSKDATKDLNEARKDAVRNLVDMRNAAASASIGEKGAQLALRRSIAELAKAQTDPSSSILDLQELELRVEESRQSLKEARLENVRARKESSRASAGGVRKDPGVVSAIRGRAEAEREVEKAKRGVAEAERDGREALEETSSAASKVEETFSKLNPQAQKFARFLFGLKPTLEGLQSTASKGLLPGVESGITSALKNLPVLDRVIGGTSRVIGNLASRVGKLVGSKGFGRELEIVGRGNARTLGQMGNAGTSLLRSLTGIMVTAQPFLKWIGRYTNSLARWIEKSVEVNRKNGDLAEFFGKTRGVVARLTSIFQSLGATLHVIGEESAPLGRQILKSFDEGAEGLERWAESTGGRNSIAQFFKDAKGPLYEAGRLVRDVITSLLQLGSGEGAEGLEDLIYQVRVELLPIFTEMAESVTETFGPHFITMLTQVLGLFGRLAGETGPLTLYVDALAGAAKVTNWFIDNVPGFHAAASGLLAISIASKTLTNLGKWTGITKGLEMAFGPELGGRLKGRIAKVLKQALVNTALATNLAYTWGGEVAGRMSAGIGKQIGKFKAVARRAAIAFIGIFVPEVAASMAAGGRLGEALSARFPKLAGMFKNGGKLAGRAFVFGLVLGVALLGVWLGKKLSDQLSEDTKEGMRNWGIQAGEDFINGLIDVVNKATEQGLLRKLGIIDPIGHVDFQTGTEEDTERRKRNRRRTNRGLREQGFEPGEVGTEIVSPGERGAVPRGEVPGDYRDRQRRRRNRNRGDGGDRTDYGLGLGGDDRRPEDDAKDTRKKVTDEHRKMRKDVDDETTRMQRSSTERFGKLRKGATDESQRMRKSVAGNVAEMSGATDRGTRSMLSSTESRFGGMREIVSLRSGRMNEDLKSNVGEMDRTTTEGMGRIQGAVVAALKAFGIKNVDLSLTGGGAKDGGKSGAKGEPAKAARGAVFTVPGEGLQDSVYLPGVHAMVAPGENLFAATRHQQPLLDYAVASTFGVGGLDDFFATYNRPHYLAKGGRATAGGKAPTYTGPNAGGLSQGILTLAGWMQHLFGHSISSGLRPTDLDSQHSTGIAADFDGGDYLGSSAYLNKFASVLDQGIYNPEWEGGRPVSVSGGSQVPISFWGPETWADHRDHQHASVPGSGRALGASGPVGRGRKAPKITTPIVNGPEGVFRVLAQAALERTTRGANAYIGRRTGNGGVAAGSLKGYVPPEPGILSRNEFLKIARLALKITGHGGMRGGALKLLKLADQESDFDTRSINNWDSNAKMGNPSGGLMHTTVSTFNAYHEPGTARTYFDPLASIASSINYQFATYGGLVTHSPYARGGRIRGFAKGGAVSPKKARWAYKHGRPVRIPVGQTPYQAVGDILLPMLEHGWKFRHRGIGETTGGALVPPGSQAVQTSKAAMGGRIRGFAGGGKMGIGPAQVRGGIGPGKDARHPKKTPPRSEVMGNAFAGVPTGKYNPEYLMGIAASTGVSLPFALLDKGVPNWRGLPVAKYAALVNEYLRGVGEYRLSLGEERKASEESFPANPLLTSVTGLSSNTISEAIGYHPPISGDISAYQSGYGTLANLDTRAEGVRGQLFGTYSESYLAPFEARRSQIITTRDRILASIQPEKEAKDYAKAKLKGLKARIRKAQKARLKAVPKNKKAKAAAQVKQRISRKVSRQIKKHTKAVQRRAEKRRKGAEVNYEQHMEENLTEPAELHREELEKRYQYETERREELAPLLNEIALNAQRTSLVGRSQSRLFALPSFARGGRVSAGVVPPAATQVQGAPSVAVPVSVRLSGAMEALNPYIAVEVDGAVRSLGQAAGVRRATVSSAGRRVSYGGK